jgi:hypothetical protein
MPPHVPGSTRSTRPPEQARSRAQQRRGLGTQVGERAVIRRDCSGLFILPTEAGWARRSRRGTLLTSSIVRAKLSSRLTSDRSANDVGWVGHTNYDECETARASGAGARDDTSHERRKELILATTKVEDFDRFLESSQRRALRSESSTGPRVRPSFAIPMRTTGSGCSSTGMGRAGRTSSPTPRSRRSCKKPGTKVGPRRRSSAASTTPSPRPRIRPLEGGPPSGGPFLPGAPNSRSQHEC